MWHRLSLRKWIGRDGRESPLPPSADTPLTKESTKRATSLSRRLSKRVGVGLPRVGTFKRQNSERRDRLAPLDPEPRRAVSADHRRTLSIQRAKSPQRTVQHRLSAPEVQLRPETDDTTVGEAQETNHENERRSITDVPEGESDDAIDAELEKRWILNLSMHFRDKSQREKFFITYAETPNRWRRVTVSCDYRGAPPDSLERDLTELRYQRDKCARIYESLRDSLPEVQFYDTVTNLKLETQDGRLHVHVTEDVNEVIPYPPVSCVGHLANARFTPESKLHFDAHLSGFVYSVRLDGKVYVKKEIPRPDTVDEFLYEINALHALNGSPYVIQVEAIIVDDRQKIVKGLLLNYAEQGALVDILYESRGEIPWTRRKRWAKQIVHGLCEIHESGYVQGDFTLSNVVVDANGDAKIIDINRRGCPIGWEPPEIAAKIESHQRISMYIGVKTDLFQLGMTLWALAMQEDEPERQSRPLLLGKDVKVPDYFRGLVAVCLSPNPRHRLSAKELLAFFPSDAMPTESPFDHAVLNGGSAGLDQERGGQEKAFPVTQSLSTSKTPDGGYSSGHWDYEFVPAPPYIERNGSTTLTNGISQAKTPSLIEESEIAEVLPHSHLPLNDKQSLEDRTASRAGSTQCPDNPPDTNLKPPMPMSNGTAPRPTDKANGVDLHLDCAPSSSSANVQWPDQAPSHNLLSQSALPINPALPSCCKLRPGGPAPLLFFSDHDDTHD